MESLQWGWGDAQLPVAPPCPRPGGAGGTGMQLGMGTGGEGLSSLSCLQQGRLEFFSFMSAVNTQLDRSWEINPPNSPLQREKPQ